MEDLEDPNLVPLLITPDGSHLDPYTNVYSRNEDYFLDWNGNMIEKEHRKTLLIEEEDVPLENNTEADVAKANAITETHVMNKMATEEASTSMYTEEE